MAVYPVLDALTSIEVPLEKVRVVVQSMEHDMAYFRERVEQVNATIAALVAMSVAIS